MNREEILDEVNSAIAFSRNFQLNEYDFCDPYVSIGVVGAGLKDNMENPSIVTDIIEYLDSYMDPAESGITIYDPIIDTHTLESRICSPRYVGVTENINDILGKDIFIIVEKPREEDYQILLEYFRKHKLCIIDIYNTLRDLPVNI